MSSPPPQTFSHYPAWPGPVTLPLTVLPDHDCPYLPGRTARTRAFLADALSPDAYHELMDAGFRRSGKLIYQPMCPGCRECKPIRVPVDQFRPTKSQRRCARRNADLRVEVGPPRPTAEKFALYQRYMEQWHRAPRESRSNFETFLYESPVQSVEFTYRDAGGALLAVGICDVCRHSLSSVYFYFDPADRRRGLGTFGVLVEIGRARQLSIPYYYMGYWIHDCDKMRYKASFRSNQTLDTDGAWRQSAPTIVGEAAEGSRCREVGR